MKKIPMRKCVVTQDQFPKDALIRVVLTPENTVEVDLSGRKNGRGAYLSKDSDVVAKAEKSKVLDRVLKTSVPKEIYDELLLTIKS